MADLWLVLITNQMACVVQGGRPPSGPKSHILFIALPSVSRSSLLLVGDGFIWCRQIVWWVPKAGSGESDS